MKKRVILMLVGMLLCGTCLGAILMAWQRGSVICHRMTYYDQRTVQHSVTKEYFKIYGYISYADRSLERLEFFQYPEVTVCTVEVA